MSLITSPEWKGLSKVNSNRKFDEKQLNMVQIKKNQFLISIKLTITCLVSSWVSSISTLNRYRYHIFWNKSFLYQCFEIITILTNRFININMFIYRTIRFVVYNFHCMNSLTVKTTNIKTKRNENEIAVQLFLQFFTPF